MSPNSQLVWLITGTSSGLGRELALAALKRGDRVIATARARSLSKLNDLKAQGADTFELDVTAPLEELHEIAEKAVALYGRIDVVVNNAGYMLIGAIEENTHVSFGSMNIIYTDFLSPQETFDQFNTNVFGAVNVSRAFLPHLRKRRTGTVIFLGSLVGWQSTPNAGLYAATKHALRGISLSLHDEIAPLGLRSLCAEFGYFRTAFLAADHHEPPALLSRIADYKPLTDAGNANLDAFHGKQPGDPLKGVEIIADVVRGEGLAAGKEFPTVLEFGSDCYNVVKAQSEKTLARLEEWKEVSFSTDFP